jgi:HEAT repeat protein
MPYLYKPPDVNELLNRRDLEALIAVLDRREAKLRADAAVALGRLGDPRAIDDLMPVLDDDELPVRRAAAQALEALGWKPKPGAAEAAYRIKLHEHARCVEIGAPAVGPLVHAFVRGDLAAGGIVEQIGGPAVEPLIAILEHADPPTARRAALVLVHLYASGALDEGHKQHILAQRATIVTHEDEARYVDTPEQRCGREHTDVGIGVAFPL